MGIILRPYQKEASRKAVAFMKDKTKDYNALMVLPTAAGKSVILSDIAFRLKASVLVLQPSKEILVQNYNKMKTYGVDCAMYSASVGVKEIAKVTFATIGSIFRKPEEFKHFKYCIVDECHTSEAEDGMFKKLFKALGKKVLGLTATPFRLESELYIVNNKTGKKRPNYRRVDKKYLKKDESYVGESQLKFLTNLENGNFKELIYAVQVSDLSDKGYLARTRYFQLLPPQWETLRMYKNTLGSDYSDKSIKYANEVCCIEDWTVQVVRRLLNPKSGIPRNGIIVFVKFVEDAHAMANRFGDIAAVVDGKTPKKDRDKILDDYKAGKIRIIFNVGVLVMGFDYPELDTIVFARPTLSLAIFYQAVGRVLRPSPKKEESWVVDLCGNLSRFGRIEDLKVESKEGEWMMTSNGQRLTDTIL